MIEGSPKESDLEMGLAEPTAVVANGMMRQIGLPNPNTSFGGLVGKVVKDWSQIVSVLGMGGGVLGSGAGVWTGDRWLIIGGLVAILAMTLLLNGRITCLKPKKKLEKQVQTLKFEVGRLADKRAELKKTKGELKQVLQQAEASIQELGEVLKVPLKQNEDLAGQIAAFNDKVSVIVDAYSRYKETAEHFSRQLNAFKNASKAAKAGNAQFGKQVLELDEVEDELSEEVDEYQDAADFQRQHNAEFKVLLDGFQKDFGKIEKYFMEMKNKLTELKEQMDKMDEIDDNFRKGGEQFQQGVKDAQKMIPQLEGQIDQLEAMVTQINQSSDLSVSEYSNNGSDPDLTIDEHV